MISRDVKTEIFAVGDSKAAKKKVKQYIPGASQPKCGTTVIFPSRGSSNTGYCQKAWMNTHHVRSVR